MTKSLELCVILKGILVQRNKLQLLAGREKGGGSGVRREPGEAAGCALDAHK